VATQYLIQCSSLGDVFSASVTQQEKTSELRTPPNLPFLGKLVSKCVTADSERHIAGTVSLTVSDKTRLINHQAKLNQYLGAFMYISHN